MKSNSILSCEELSLCVYVYVRMHRVWVLFLRQYLPMQLSDGLRLVMQPRLISKSLASVSELLGLQAYTTMPDGFSLFKCRDSYLNLHCIQSLSKKFKPPNRNYTFTVVAKDRAKNTNFIFSRN